MSVPDCDWLIIWKLWHYPWFFWSYASIGVLARLLVLPRLNPTAPIRTWLLSSTGSLLIVPAVPLLVLPASVLAALAGARASVYSLRMAIPIVLSIGLANALIDGILLRLLLRQSLGLRRMWFVIGVNLFVAGFATAVVMLVRHIHPIEMIASVHSL